MSLRTPSFHRASLHLLLYLFVAACLGHDSRLESIVAAAPPSNDAHGESEHDGPSNRLGLESSPYLRMHMHNPVDWYPWGKEAFDKARAEKKIIFLSVGYSSCYWCHVMERESFMDEEIAAFLNENFVCIKVDREERPDVDSIYMLAVQILTRRGGWPMSVFMTPDAKPFFGGTYFPARDGDRPGSAGFLTIVRRLRDVWKTQPAQINQTADRLTAAIRSEMAGPEAIPDVKLDETLTDPVYTALAKSFDSRYGGFGFNPAEPQTPKFPEPSNLVFLLERYERTKSSECLQMLEATLDKMAMGGIWDHLGGGFHRYSVDRFWRIPHFEKMLYDNGQLLSVYSRAYRLTDKPLYRRVVDQTVEFLLREMRDEGGAFVAALDAESEKVEGKFYRWEKAQVQQLLGGDFAKFAGVYGLNGAPNFEHDYYVPQLSEPWPDLAKSAGLAGDDQLDQQLRPLRDKLLAIRNQRVRPLTDSKILCSWNGLMIRGLADAGRFCERPAYTEAAVAAANFLLTELRTDDGRLQRTYTAGTAKLNAYLDDYAFLIDGLIALHQATGQERWLKEAKTLIDQQQSHYGDAKNGGFFFTAEDHEALISRSKQLTDGAQPSGNALAASNFVYLAKQLNDASYRQIAEDTIKNAGPLLQRYPAGAPRMAAVVESLLRTAP